SNYKIESYYLIVRYNMDYLAGSYEKLEKLEKVKEEYGDHQNGEYMGYKWFMTRMGCPVIGEDKLDYVWSGYIIIKNINEISDKKNEEIDNEVCISEYEWCITHQDFTIRYDHVHNRD